MKRRQEQLGPDLLDGIFKGAWYAMEARRLISPWGLQGSSSARLRSARYRLCTGSGTELGAQALSLGFN